MIGTCLCTSLSRSVDLTIANLGRHRVLDRVHADRSTCSKESATDDPEIEKLGEADAEEIAAIALATEPGPWAELTHSYLNPYGIRRNGKLAAMAGQRMAPAADLMEVSGVCTWPEFRGQGLASRLIRRVMENIRSQGAVPYLHSYSHNKGAIALYKSLGFRPRSSMVCTVLRRA